jgi:flagellar biosynthesis protein FliR
MNLLAEPPQIWAAYFLIVCRVGTIFMVAPLFGSRSTPTQVKIALSLVLSLVMLPLATANLTTLPDTAPEFLGLVAREILVGVLVGFAVQVVFTALAAAGHIVGLQMGFSLANVVDPLTASHTSLLDQYYALLATLVFFTVNGHHALIVAVQQTFELVPIGGTEFVIPSGPVLLRWGSEIFAIALRIALPVMAALLLADVALAVMARSVPQLNVFVVGMPAKLIVAFGLLVITIPIAVMIMGRSLVGLGQTTAALLRGV